MSPWGRCRTAGLPCTHLSLVLLSLFIQPGSTHPSILPSIPPSIHQSTHPYISIQSSNGVAFLQPLPRKTWNRRYGNMVKPETWQFISSLSRNEKFLLRYCRVDGRSRPSSAFSLLVTGWLVGDGQNTFENWRHFAFPQFWVTGQQKFLNCQNILYHFKS